MTLVQYNTNYYFKAYLIGVLAVVLAGLNSPASNKSILKFAEVGEITGFSFYKNAINYLIIINNF